MPLQIVFQQPVEAITLAVVLLISLYFLVLGATSLIVPDRACGFLLGFVRSAPIHYAELMLRFIAGIALIRHAPHMSASGVFSLLGWMLLVTTICLLVVPWRWHQRFAQQFVPRVTRYIRLIGLTSLIMGSLILVAVASGINNPSGT